MFSILLFCVVTSMTFTTDAVVTKIAIIHRHGIRTAMRISPSLDKQSVSYTCSDLDSCELTPRGKAMLRGLGQYLNTTYRSILPAKYDKSIIRTRSSALDRTIQSAEAMLDGLYPDDPTAAPVVLMYPNEYMLLRDTYPSRQLYSAVHGDVNMTDYVLGLVGTDGMQAVGEWLGGIQGWCMKNIADCAWLAQDRFDSYYSDGTPAMSEDQVRLLPKLEKVSAAMYHVTELFNGDVNFRRQVGYLGYPLLNQILTDLKSSTPIKLFHYSAHDDTLMSLYNALGPLRDDDMESDMNTPGFGEALAIELSDTQGVSFYRLTTSQHPNSTYVYTASPLSVNCTDADGSVTVSFSCSMDSFSRLVQSRGAASKDPACYASTEDLQTSGCLATGVAPQGACRAYREQCPSNACPVGSYLDVRNGYTCVKP